VIVTGTLTLHFLNGTVSVRPSWMGKTATALQMVAIGVYMLQYNPFQKNLVVGRWNLDVAFLDIPVWLAGIFTLLSGMGYIAQGIAQVHHHGHPDEEG